MLSILGSSPDAFDEVAVETTRLMAEFVSSVLRNSNELEQRRQLVEELQESESRFRGAFHSSSLGMALTALDGTFVQVNDKLAEMLGYTVDELSSLGVRGITHPDDIDGRRRARQATSQRRDRLLPPREALPPQGRFGHCGPT